MDWLGFPRVLEANPATGISYGLTITNAGKSPAFDVNIGVGDWKQDAKLVRLLTEKCSGDDCRERNIGIVPGGQIGMRIPTFGNPLPQIGETAWLIVRIDYRDSEGRSHKTGICFTNVSNFATVTGTTGDQRTIVTEKVGCTIPNSNYAD